MREKEPLILLHIVCDKKILNLVLFTCNLQKTVQVMAFPKFLLSITSLERHLLLIISNL